MLLPQILELNAIFFTIIFSIIIEHKLILVPIDGPELAQTTIIGLFNPLVLSRLIFL
jgi:hypothetical protein